MQKRERSENLRRNASAKRNGVASDTKRRNASGVVNANASAKNNGRGGIVPGLDLRNDESVADPEVKATATTKAATATTPEHGDIVARSFDADVDVEVRVVVKVTATTKAATGVRSIDIDVEVRAKVTVRVTATDVVHGR